MCCGISLHVIALNSISTPYFLVLHSSTWQQSASHEIPVNYAKSGKLSSIGTKWSCIATHAITLRCTDAHWILYLNTHAVQMHNLILYCRDCTQCTSRRQQRVDLQPHTYSIPLSHWKLFRAIWSDCLHCKKKLHSNITWHDVSLRYFAPYGLSQ